MCWEGHWGDVRTYVEKKRMLLPFMFKLTVLIALSLLLLNLYIVISTDIRAVSFPGIERANLGKRQALTPFFERVLRSNYSCKMAKLCKVRFIKSIHAFLIFLQPLSW